MTARDSSGSPAWASGLATFGFFCGSIALAVVAFYIWSSLHFAYYYRQRECAWDLPGEGFPWLMVATVSCGTSLLLVATLLIHNNRRTSAPMRHQRIMGLGLAALLVTGALTFVLGLLMGAGMECFD
jgi:hypothetical protein